MRMSDSVRAANGPPQPPKNRRADVIDYEIFGEEMQFAEITLDPGEMVIAEAGSNGTVRGYVKNNGLGFEVPYTFMGDERGYRPDFIVLVEDGRVDPLHVVVEIKGFRGPDAQAKHDALMRLWLPAVNNDGRWGRWQAMEIVEPTDITIQFSEKVWAEPKQGEAALKLIADRLEVVVKQARPPDSAAAA